MLNISINCLSSKLCVCVWSYLYFQDWCERFSIFCNPSDVKSSAENGRVVILVLDVNYHLSRVSWDTETIHMLRWFTFAFGITRSSAVITHKQTEEMHTISISGIAKCVVPAIYQQEKQHEGRQANCIIHCFHKYYSCSTITFFPLLVIISTCLP